MLQKVLILATSLNVLHNYFDGPNKIIFSDLYQVKFVNTSTKLLSANTIFTLTINSIYNITILASIYCVSNQNSQIGAQFIELKNEFQNFRKNHIIKIRFE